jgi:hypothetical protein
MDEIVHEIVQKTGLPEAQAREAAQTVVNFIKQKLPPAIAAQVDGFLNSQQGDDIAKQVFGDLFGQSGT